MPDDSRPVSFRLQQDTVSLLDAAARASGQTRNALVERLLSEALRIERHPLIRFQDGARGRRRPLLVGTRLDVHQIISTVRSSGNNVAEAADYLGLRTRQVEAAVDYYADFQPEIDEDALVAGEAEAAERDRWERRTQALA